MRCLSTRNRGLDSRQQFLLVCPSTNIGSYAEAVLLSLGHTIVRNTRYDGFAAGAGLTFGYVASISNRWTIDAHAGIGLVLFHQKKTT